MAAGVYIVTAYGRAILDDGDAVHISVARNMAETGDWVTPYTNGVRFFDKPPMIYWLTAASFRVFGINEFAARVPTICAVVAIALLLFFLGRQAGGLFAGFVAGSAFVFCVGTFLFTCSAFPDIFFVFFLTLSVTAFYIWYQDERNPIFPALLFYAASAGAVLSKGLLGLAFPAVIAFLFLIWSRKFRRLRHFHLVKGTLLFFLLAAPWHILAEIRDSGFLWYYFVHEQFLRFLGKRHWMDYESIALPLFWALALAWLIPWSAFLPALRHVWRDAGDGIPANGNIFRACARIFDVRQERIGRRVLAAVRKVKPDAVLRQKDLAGAENVSVRGYNSAARDAVRICFCWAFVILVFFSVSPRIEHYSMPIFPPLAVLIGAALSLKGITANRAEKTTARGFAFLGLLGCAAALLLIVGGLWLTFGSFGDTGQPQESARLHAYKYYFAPLFEMPPEIVGRLKTPLVGTLTVMALGFVCAWFLARRGRRIAAVLAMNLTMAGFCFFAWQSLGICEGFISSRQFGQKLNELYRPGDAAVVLGDFETANSINFYAPVPLYIYNGSADLLRLGMSYPDAPQMLLTPASFVNIWEGNSRTFLLAPEDRLPSLGLQSAWPVLRSYGRVLISNQALSQSLMDNGNSGYSFAPVRGGGMDD